ncbi:MAG TPA: RagB/SusD family nutrient uptake outer membrane protein [Longimicrobiaceae bacterium]|nr:RagB/SusD family nutrient uptake outer membrane protein [Longimicrobiaceae bacterium]
MYRKQTFRFRTPRWITATALATLVLASCDTEDLLKVEAPSQLPAEDLENPRNAALLVNGAVADFECAYGAFVTVQGIIADELSDAQLGAAAWFYDRRDSNLAPGSAYGENSCSSNQTPGIYRPLSTARWAADNALTYLEGWTDEEVDNRQDLIAQAALYSGFSYNLLGMAMCSAAIDGGPEVTSAELLAAAEGRYTRAMEAATAEGLTDVATAARIGRARVRLYLGDTAGALADAQDVPLDFVYNASASQDNNRRYNRVFASNVLSTNYSIEEVSRNIMTAGVEDPRTLTSSAGVTANDGTELWIQHKYPDYSTPIPIVTGAEAALIVAEIQGGQAAVDAINSLRDRVGLPHYAGGTEAEIQQKVIEERRRELWLEGHRLYDIARFGIPRVPAIGTPFAKGGIYGNTTCLPLPDVERFNNPNIS